MEGDNPRIRKAPFLEEQVRRQRAMYKGHFRESFGVSFDNGPFKDAPYVPWEHGFGVTMGETDQEPYIPWK